MIRVYLIRHGIAADPVPEVPDESRPLTAKGRRRFRRAAREFGQMVEPIDHVFTSPLVRAVQTAEILARALKQDEVGVLEKLCPGVPVSKLFAAVVARVKDDEAVALVGHDPQMSLLVDALPPGKSEPRWNLKPRSRAIVEGLPLAKTTADRPSKTPR